MLSRERVIISLMKNLSKEKYQKLRKVVRRNICADAQDGGVDELSGRLAKVPNILSVRGQRLIPDARDIAHYGDVLKGIWWYQLTTGTMRYSTKSLSHLDDEFAETVEPFSRQWVRGRVGDDRGMIYAFLYRCDFKSRVIPGSIAVDMLRKLSQRSSLRIRYFVDEKGYSLCR